MELIQGKSYKIKRVKKYFNGEHNPNGSWKKKQKTIWIDGIYIGTNGSYCTFDIGNGKEIDIPKDDIETKIKDYEQKTPENIWCLLFWKEEIIKWRNKNAIQRDRF